MSVSQQGAIRVVLADDHKAVRAGICHLLQREPDIQVVGEAADGREALELADRLEPDVLVLDIEMPEVGGVQVARQLQERQSPVRILVLSAHSYRSFVAQLLLNGAAGYLSKIEAPEYLVPAVRAVHSGQTGWLSPQGQEALGNS